MKNALFETKKIYDDTVLLLLVFFSKKHTYELNITLQNIAKGISMLRYYLELNFIQNSVLQDFIW